MAKFNFELDTVLKYRKQSESNKKNQLMNEINDLNVKKEDLGIIISTLKNANNKFSETMKNNVSILNLQSHYSYMSFLDNSRKSKEKDVASQNVAVENTRMELIDISISKKTLEIIEEKKFEDFKRELIQIEQNENDERNCYNHSRKKTI
jgi:flagellar FliJ protein